MDLVEKLALRPDPIGYVLFVAALVASGVAMFAGDDARAPAILFALLFLASSLSILAS